MKLLIPHDFSYEKYHPDGALPYEATGAKLRDDILARSSDIDVMLSTNAADTERALPEAEAVVCFSMSRARLAQAPRLRWIQAASAGIDHFFKSSDVGAGELARRGIALTSAAGVSQIVIGEHVFAMLLALSRGVPAAVRQQMAHRWHIFSGTELHGKTMAIVGLGAIGERVAQLARAFGMRAIGIRRHVSQDYDGAAHEVRPPEDLPEVLGQAHVLVLACSLTPQTRGLICRETLDRMRPGVLLVNVARGEVIVEQDLVDALRSGRVAAAALDTFGQPGIRGELQDLEALPPGSPYWDMDNVLVMPNNAASTENIFSYLAAIIGENHDALVKGLPLKRRVELNDGRH